MRYSPTRRRQRRAARIALYSSLTVSIALLILLSSLAVRFSALTIRGAWEERDYPNLPEVKLLQKYIQIDTSQATGSELAGAEFLANQLREAGIEAHIERLGERGANLWAIIEGEDPQALVLHNHIDVTPIERPEEWGYPPFGGTIDMPWIFGRGAFDMKSVSIAQLLAMIDVQRSGVRPRRSLIFLATGDEETGSELGTRWILSHHPELVRRFWAVVTEGGIVEAVSRHEVKYWGIESTQRRLLTVIACSSSRARLEALHEDLKDLEATDGTVKITPEVREFLAVYGPNRGRQQTREILAMPERIRADIFGVRELPPYLRSLLRNEAYPASVEIDGEGGYRLRISVQLLPGVDPKIAIADLLPSYLTEGVSLSIGSAVGSAQGSPVDHPLMIAASETVSARYPETPTGPFFIPWSVTDARFFRGHGIPAYGFSPFLILPTDTIHVDAPNERIALPGFVQGTELYRDFVRRLTG